MNELEFSFELIAQDEKARLGKIFTPRGVVETPAFMPVGTLGTVKGIFTEDLLSTGAQIILANTYHLMIRPGTETLDIFGGLHNYMSWQKPILTDSGGFQIMSLAKLNKIDINIGAVFSSHLDGKKFVLSPEKSIQIEFGKNKAKALFGIVQGGLDKNLRLNSLEKLTSIDFDGYAMGGLAVGETQDQMFSILNDTVDFMPKEKPRYLMGVGTPSDILGAVKNGIDMFDCVMPTRSGRTGLAFTWDGKLNLRNAKYQKDKTPLDVNTSLRSLNMYSKSYLNHLIKSNEILASMLISLHNINFYQQFMSEIRKEIKKGTFINFYNKYIDKF